MSGDLKGFGDVGESLRRKKVSNSTGKGQQKDQTKCGVHTPVTIASQGFPAIQTQVFLSPHLGRGSPVFSPFMCVSVTTVAKSMPTERSSGNI